MLLDVNLNNSKSRWMMIGGGAILLVCAYFVYLYRLDAYDLYLWDEARNAVSALEMSNNGDYIVRYYDGQMDDWELKPPMLMWLQILFSKIVGWNVLATRLPVALAVVSLVLVLYIFVARITQSVTAGFFASMVLMCSIGFGGEHIARTGDHDGLAVFWLTLYALLTFKFIEHPENQKWLPILICVCMACAVLTKSIVGLFYVPGILIYLVFSGKLIPVLRNPHSYIGIAVLMGTIVAYYLLRETRQPGYFDLVWRGELFPRYANTENKFMEADWNYYLLGFVNGRFYPWIYWLIPSAVLTFALGSVSHKKITTYALLTVIPVLFVISSGTKNPWYDAPTYPLMCIIIGDGVDTSIRYLFRHGRVLGFAGLLIVLIYSGFCYEKAFQSMKKVNNVRYGPVMYARAMKHFLQVNGVSIPLYAWHERTKANSAHLLFYSLTQPQHTVYPKSVEELVLGKQVYTCDAASAEQIHQLFETDTLSVYDDVCVLLEIKSMKSAQ
jgi:4-amino-4-deoxy-L-arabinose transferase-like glycosyltransferase